MRRVANVLLSLLLLAPCVCPMARANEPSWSDEERAERSVAVISGTVRSVERVGGLNGREDLYRAIVVIERVEKNPPLVGGGRIVLYFEHPKSGPAGARCPTYVELAQGQKARFFIRLRKVGDEVRAFLEMGSDVRGAHGVKG